MPRQSAGILPFRQTSGQVEVFLVHPGGPLWARKDEGAWSIPKGEFGEGEEPLSAAKREFSEETGFAASNDLIPLEPIKQPSGKVVHAWAMRADLDPSQLKSNTFSMIWPPRSGRTREFPEIDKGSWFDVETALRKILQGQAGFISQLQGKLKAAC